MGLSSLGTVVGSSWSPGQPKPGSGGSRLGRDSISLIFLIFLPCACPGLRMVHSPEEVALNKDLEPSGQLR